MTKFGSDDSLGYICVCDQLCSFVPRILEERNASESASQLWTTSPAPANNSSYNNYSYSIGGVAPAGNQSFSGPMSTASLEQGEGLSVTLLILAHRRPGELRTTIPKANETCKGLDAARQQQIRRHKVVYSRVSDETWDHSIVLATNDQTVQSWWLRHSLHYGLIFC
ncbi:hypothetical protein GQ43DRAFT_433526 [Delitschia confertaspora ATCC 74209]|uniref:Uncharacterized protein n=1 Tax=Delitschia confertaspora ATCC 74209 TaxID=1513339 RepID=A0A9P4JMQ4_9PLEO|nr:hypothetical protein GQ43DRAFT_433526 [Delitschia confertaspora ATCC 74209]